MRYIRFNNIELEYEGSPAILVKVNGARPEYMNGHDLIRLLRAVAGLCASVCPEKMEEQ